MNSLAFLAKYAYNDIIKDANIPPQQIISKQLKGKVQTAVT